MAACHFAILLLVWCVRVQSEQTCDQTRFLHLNGTCVACPACGPGQQLSEDCGFGDGGKAVCTLCEGGSFSPDTGVAPCRRCTKCNLLNRLEKNACSPRSDALCGQCLPGCYELRSITGEAELSCAPCYRRDTVHKECLHVTSHGSETGKIVRQTEADVTVPGGHFKEPEEKRVKEERQLSVVRIGSATASTIFLLALLLWAFLLTSEKLKKVPEHFPEPEGLLSEADVQGPNSLSHENEVSPTSIVINVTTNYKPSSEQNDNLTQEDRQHNCYSTEEMEQKLQTIWEMAKGHGIEMLDYDSVQDLSLLLDSVDRGNTLRRLGRSLGVPPQVVAHLKGFQDLFQYLRTSTYTLLPQLAQAAALLPNPEVVARIHGAVVNK